MEGLDKTLLTSNEQELKKIYDEEVEKLKSNEFKMKILQSLTIEDFPRDIPEASKKNLERALLAAKIRDQINLGNNQKLLGLDGFDISKVNLSYMEKKLIQERVEHAVKLESMKRKQAQRETNEVDGQLEAAQNKFIELQKENIAMTETLADLKRQELELWREVAETIAGPTQKELVQGILDDARIVNMQLENMKQTVQSSEMSRTSFAKKAVAEISGFVDDLKNTKAVNKK